MNIYSIYLYDLDLWRKDHKGVVLPPSVFNNWIQFVSMGMFDDVFSQAETIAAQGNIDISDVIFKSTVLGNFIKDIDRTPSQATVGGLTTGYIEIPTDCKYPLGMLSVIPTNKGEVRTVSLKSPLLKTKYRGSVLNGDVGANPIGFVEDGRIEFIPNNLTDLILTYLRRPAVPMLDWCMSSNDQVIFMPVGSKIKIVVNGAVTTKVLYDSADVVLASDVIKDDMTASEYTSKTVELDWDETQHLKIANAVAEKLGINLRIQTQSK